MSVFRKVEENIYTFENVPIDYFKVNSDLKNIPLDAEIFFDNNIPALKNISSKVIGLLDLSNRKVKFKGFNFENDCVFNAENSELTFINYFGEKDSPIELVIKTKGTSKSIFFNNLSNVKLTLIKCNTNHLKIESAIKIDIKIFNVNSNTLDLLKINESDLNINNTNVERLTISYSDFLTDFKFNNCTIVGIQLGNLTCQENAFIEVYKMKELFITNCNFKKIDFHQNNRADVPERIEVIRIQNLKTNGFFFYSVLNRISIKMLFLLNASNFSFRNLKIIKLELNGLFKEKNHFETCEIRNLIFLTFNTYNKLTFNNCRLFGEAKIEIKYSILENVVLKSSFLHQAKDIKFKESSLIGLKAYNLLDLTDEAVKNIDNDTENDSITLFRELKTLAEVDNNQHLFQRFRALEYNSILARKTYKFKTQDQIILYLNKWSNDHSTNPFYAFGWIVVLSLFFAAILVLSLYLNKVSFGFKEITRNLDYFLNPLKFLKSYNVEFCSIVYVLEIGYKLALGYLIYQFIAAFRRFNK
jgi:hypothetical protein